MSAELKENECQRNLLFPKRMCFKKEKFLSNFYLKRITRLFYFKKHAFKKHEAQNAKHLRKM